MATSSNTQSDGNFRSRRSHTKSRHGCVECKRRRVKCDEKKPACSRCVSTLQKCKYSPFQLSLTRFVPRPLVLPSPPDSNASLSPSALELSLSPACEGSAISPDLAAVSYTGPRTPVTPGRSPVDLSDTGLYHHYLEHTGCTLTLDDRDRGALESRMPTLALQHKSVLHALLAVSAVCLCCDRISTGAANADEVEEALTTGYRHYHLASKLVRGLLSSINHGAAEAVVSSTVLLIPFAAASQQVNDWLSRQLEWPGPGQSLASTPRDIVTMLRGVRITFEALNGDVEQAKRLRGPASGGDRSSAMAKKSRKELEPRVPYGRHHMYPILSKTSEAAFLALRVRMQLATSEAAGICSEDIMAYREAFNLLDGIRSDIFSAAEKATPVSPRTTTMPGWLNDYISRPAIATQDAPLTRPLLAFLVEVPQIYLSRLLPLLEQRLERPIDSAESADLGDLSVLDRLALDIYAHWSVLMFLVQDESWWIGTLPIITLSGMLNRYGSMLADQSYCQNEGKQQQRWWPGTMLRIMQETTL